MRRGLALANALALRYNLSMLLEEYDEQACIRTWQEDGFIKGHEAGLQEKAVEDAIMLIHDFNVTPEVAAEKMKAPLEQVLTALTKVSVTN